MKKYSGISFKINIITGHRRLTSIYIGVFSVKKTYVIRYIYIYIRYDVFFPL